MIYLIMLRGAINTLTIGWRVIKTSFGIPIESEPFINKDAFRKIAPCTQPERRFSPGFFLKTEDLAKRHFVPLHVKYIPKATLLAKQNNINLEQVEVKTIEQAMEFRKSIPRPPNSKPIPYYNDEILKMKLNEIDWSRCKNLVFNGAALRNVVKKKKI